MGSLARCAALVAATFAAATAVRYALIESDPIVHLCGSAGAPSWCAPRSFAIAVLGTSGLAVIAVATALAALLTRSSGWALAAACLGMIGLVLHSPVSGALAFLLGVLVLARPRHARRERAA